MTRGTRLVDALFEVEVTVPGGEEGSVVGVVVVVVPDDIGGELEDEGGLGVEPVG